MAMFLAYTSDADQVEYTENTVAATLVEKSVTSNGTYNAASDNADGYSKVTVNVSQTEPVLITKNITSNGSYSASSDSADGYSNVNVNVSGGTVSPKTITENGTYHASSENLDGYSTVTVSVPQSSGGSTLIHKEIAANGTYQASSDNADGFSSVTVIVPQSGSTAEVLEYRTYMALSTQDINTENEFYGIKYDISSYLTQYGNTIGYTNFIIDIQPSMAFSLSNVGNTPYKTVADSMAVSGDTYAKFQPKKGINRTEGTLYVGYTTDFYIVDSSKNRKYYRLNDNYSAYISIIFIPPTT